MWYALDVYFLLCSQGIQILGGCEKTKSLGRKAFIENRKAERAAREKESSGS